MRKRGATNADCSSDGDTLTDDPEFRLVTDVSGGVTTTFVYDGDGARVKKTVSAGGTVTNTYYVGNYYEAAVVGGNTTTTKYYYFGAQRIAMRQSSAGTYVTTYLYGDHPSTTLRTGLGSTSAASTDGVISKQTYYAYGAVRTTDGTLPTDHAFTGQKVDSYVNLIQMGARWYDYEIGRFTQPDTIVPDIYKPQSLYRYAYVRNNLIRYTDPTGHKECDGDNGCDRENGSEGSYDFGDDENTPSDLQC